MSSLLSPAFKLNRRKYSTRKYVWHRLWKGNRSMWGSKHNEWLCWSSRPKRSLKKMLWEILQNSQENICAGISFLVLSCEFCEICKKTFFAEQQQTTASDYSSININSSERSTGKQNCKLWYKSTAWKVYSKSSYLPSKSSYLVWMQQNMDQN